MLGPQLRGGRVTQLFDPQCAVHHVVKEQRATVIGSIDNLVRMQRIVASAPIWSAHRCTAAVKVSRRHTVQRGIFGDAGAKCKLNVRFLPTQLLTCAATMGLSISENGGEE